MLHGGAREIGSRENFLQDLEPLPRFGGVVEVEVILIREGVVEVGERCGKGEI